MRPTTLISFLATSLVLLSQSPAVYPAPIPSQSISAGEKRCYWTGCRIAEPTTTNTTTTDATPQTDGTPTVLGVVDALINALTTYRNQFTSSGSPTITDIIVPSDSSDDPTDDTTTTDGSPSRAAVYTPELAGESL